MWRLECTVQRRNTAYVDAVTGPSASPALYREPEDSPLRHDLGTNSGCSETSALPGALGELDRSDVRSLPTNYECWGWRPGALQRARAYVTARGCGDLFSEKLLDGNALDELWAALGRLTVEHLHRLTSYRGSDVRPYNGSVDRPNRWPREELQVGRGRWKLVSSFPQTGKHINALELRAILATVRWRTRGAKSIQARCIHVTDSQVCIAVCTKGRSSARHLNSLLIRLNALVLASGLRIAYAFVGTEANPADKPSRWPKRE